jgi:UDP-glucose 4-epimerase
VRRVVFISSGAVYGDQGEQPLKEDALPDPRSPYAVSKLSAEFYVRTMATWGIETVSLRVQCLWSRTTLATVAPGDPEFLRQAIRNHPGRS